MMKEITGIVLQPLNSRQVWNPGRKSAGISSDPQYQNLAHLQEYQAHLGWVSHPLIELLQHMIYAFPAE